MRSDSKLAATGLIRDYAGARVVHGVDLELQSSEILGLLGPNGAGKTTTLRMLAGTLTPSAGRVTIAGFDLAATPERAKRCLGYLPERPPLYPELTVDEYLGFCARLHGVARRDRRTAVDRARHDCGLADTGARLIGQLSKGYQQRVGIAQAIVHRPEVLILDEPTAGLDPNQLSAVRALIRWLAHGRGVILSSHILPEIEAVASRVVILHEGRKVCDEPLTGRDDNATVIEVGFIDPPAAAELEALAGVRAAEPIGHARWALYVEPGPDQRAAIAAAAVARGWGLTELGARTHDLQARFAALTTGRADPASSVTATDRPRACA